MSSEPERISASEALKRMAEIAHHIEILDVAIRSASYRADPYEPNSEEQLKPGDSDMASRVMYARPDDSLTSGALVGYRQSFVTANKDARDQFHKALIEVEFEVEYRITTDDPVDELAIEAFTRINGIYITWSYWREFLANACSRMHVTTIPTMPLLHRDLTAAIAGYSNSSDLDNASDRILPD